MHVNDASTQTTHNEETEDAYVVVATAIVVGVIVGLVATWWIGLVAGVLSGVIVAVILPKSAPAGLATVFAARPAPEPEFPRYHNLMEGLSISSGSVMPTLQVIDEARPNLAVYGPPDEGVVIATTGLLEQLDRVELEGVLAEALVRLRSVLLDYRTALSKAPTEAAKRAFIDSGNSGPASVAASPASPRRPSSGPPAPAAPPRPASPPPCAASTA